LPLSQLILLPNGFLALSFSRLGCSAACGLLLWVADQCVVQPFADRVAQRRAQRCAERSGTLSRWCWGRTG
jgi:hypothetical protein